MMTCLLVVFSAVFVACDDSDAPDTNQIKGGVSLSAAQLQLTRGGYMQFKGSGLDQIETVIFPEAISVTDIEVVDQYTIRCLVPDDAVPGKVKLLHGDEVIETGQIAFTEPITLESFTPSSVKAGDELTIKGTYLNYIDHVMFETGEAVPVTPTRNEIKVVVPVDASSGKVYLVMTVVQGTDTLINQIPSKEEIVVATPADIKLPAGNVKAGSTISITGSLLRLVKSVRFQNADDVNVAQADPTKDISEISVVVPANAKSGAVTLVLHSGVEVAAGTITLVAPTVVIDNIKESYGVDETVVISGTDLDLVVTAAFTNDEAKAVTLVDGKINLKVTAAAQSGGITLTMANGNTVVVDGFVTTKPVATFPSDATPLDELSIVSTLGSRVKTVLFGELEAEATVTDNGFKVIVPLDAETGKITLVMDNDENIDAGSLTINAFTFCAVTKFDAATTTVGSLCAATIVNGVNLTDVLLNGVSTKYLVVGDKLYASVGVKVGDNQLTLVSGSVNNTYTIKVIASGVVENVIWANGPLMITWKEGGRVMIPASAFNSVPLGSKMRFYFTDNDGKWAQAQVNNGQWKSFFTFVPSDVASYDWYNVKNTERYYDVVLTSDMMTSIQNDKDDDGNGIIIQGSDLIFSKVSILIDYSAIAPIWLGSAEVSGWSTSFTALTWGAYDFSGLSVGQVVTVNYTATADATMRIGNGNWTAFPSTLPIAKESGDTKDEGNITISAGTSSISFTLTAEDISSIQTKGGLGVYGGDFVVNKVQIK